MERYRKSFALGVLHPRGSPHGAAQLLVECPLDEPDAEVVVVVRFHQEVVREALDAGGDPVPELLLAGRRYAGGEETIEHEVQLSSLPERTAVIETAGTDLAELTEEGAPAGALLWRRQPMHGTVEAWIEELDRGLALVRVAVANRMEWDDTAPRRSAMMRALRTTEVELHSPSGALASLSAVAA
ncbi:MAG TPA: hypothetical protein VIS95_00630 [Solirubrobacterales bacterium]